MTNDEPEELFEEERIQIKYEPSGITLLSDITGLIALFNTCFEAAGSAQRKKKIEKLLANDWFEHYRDSNGRRVLSETEFIEHKHELETAICLCQANYDVIFAPKGMFSREEKKFDIFLIRDTVIVKADLKNITSKNPDTIAKRIKGGSDQANRVVIHISSDIENKVLIDGLRSGVERNSLIKEILLFYKKNFYRLPKNKILSKEIFKLLK
jgi:hypothetical protein